MGFVIRPILMFSEYVPAITGERDWQYQVLGHHDGMDVKEPIYMDTTESFQQIFKNYIKETNTRDYAVQVYFGLHYDDGREEEFWKNNTKFMFIMFIQFREKVVSEYNRILEETSGKEGETLEARAYYTLDYNDSIVVLKSDRYETGMKFIARLQDNEEDLFPFEISSSYTIFAFDRKKINEADATGEKDDIIEKVELRIIESFQGSIALLYAKLKKRLEKWKDIKRYMLFGTDDEAIVIENIPVDVFLKLYLGKSGILCNSNKITQIYASAITTKILFPLSDGNPHKNFNTDNKGSREFCDILCKYIKKSYENKYTAYAIAEENTLLKITNALGKIEYARNKNGKINEYNFFTLFLPFSVFVLLHTKEKARTDEYFEFLTYFNICTLNYDKPDRVFLQTADFNIRYFEMQTKYITLYNAYIHSLKKMLNTPGENQYEFILCPGKSERTEVHEFYKKGDNKYRLYEVDMAETRMYDVKDMLCILGHEVAHYVGTKIRNREDRYKHMLRMSSRAIVIIFQMGFKKAGYGDEVGSLDIWKDYEEKLTEWIELYINRYLNPEYWKQILGDEEYERKKKDIEQRYIPVFEDRIQYTDEMQSAFEKAMKDMLRLQGEDIFEKIIWELFKKKIEKGEVTYDDKNTFINSCRLHMQDVIDMFTSETEEMGWFFNIADVLNTELFMLKECYADLISILSLKLTLREYLCTIVNEILNVGEELKKLEYTDLIVRIAIVMSVMSYRENQSKKYYTWTNDEIITNKDDRDIIMLQNMALDFCQLYIANDMPQNPNFDIYSSASIFYDYKVLREIISYLLHCREEFYKVTDEKKAKKVLRFKRIAEHTDINCFYDEVMNLIMDYENDIYAGLPQSVNKINEEMYEGSTDERKNNRIN